MVVTSPLKATATSSMKSSFNGMRNESFEVGNCLTDL
jgi:hypothetical protein